MRIVFPIAFGLAIVVCSVLCFYCWRIQRVRKNLSSIQVSATPDENLHSRDKVGYEKDAVSTLPTLKTSELQHFKEQTQCPICLVQYEEAELLRQLPHCGHIFHMRCVDSWLENQTSCPVCRTVLITDQTQDRSLQSSYCRGPSNTGSVTVELAPAIPSWVLVNRPHPLPASNPGSSSGSFASGRMDSVEPLDHHSLSMMAGESPLLMKSQPQPQTQLHSRHDDWGSMYMEDGHHGHDGSSFQAGGGGSVEIVVETKGGQSSNSPRDRWTAEPFSFAPSSSEDFDSSETGKRSSSRTDQSGSTSTDSSSSDSTASGQQTDQSTHCHLMDLEYPPEEAFQIKSSNGHNIPLTIAPENCSFEFLPIITGPGGDYSFRPPKLMNGTATHHTYNNPNL